LGFAQVDQAAQCAFAVRRSRVDQNAGHRAVRLISVAGVDAFAQAGGGVAALQRELAHEGMGEGVQHGISYAGISSVRIKIARLSPAAMRCLQSGIAFGDLGLLQPRRQASLIKANEDAFTAHFHGGHPCRRFARQGHPVTLALGGWVFQFVR
jgi:hypothetical protein